MRQYLTIRDKVEKILKEIPDEKFKKVIEKDVALFVDAFVGNHSKSVKLHFLIFLEYLSRKHGSSIVTRAYLIKNFSIKKSGWMKRQKKMIEMGIIESINNRGDYMVPARRIIDEVGVAGIITDEHYKNISKIFTSIPHDYPEAMRGKSKEVIIAFLAICYTSEYETIDDIVLMFRDLEIHRGLSVGDVWEEKLFRTFYKSIQRLKKSGTLVPEFKINIAKHIKAAKLILNDLYDYGHLTIQGFLEQERRQIPSR